MRFHLSGAATLLATLILTGCNTISPHASQRNPRRATRKKNATKSFPR